MAKIAGMDASAAISLLVVVMVGFLAALVAASYLGVLPSGGGVVVNPGTGAGGGGVLNVQTVCGSDQQGKIQFRAKNDGNLTGTEWTGDVLYLYLVNSDGTVGQSVGTITSGGTSAYVGSSDLACGQKFKGYVLSVDGASGVNSKIVSVASSEGVSLNADGGVDITLNQENVYVEAHKQQHATLEFRYFDVDNNAYSYDAGDSSNADWETTGVTFTGVVDNSTGIVVANNAQITGRLYTRALQPDTDFNSDTGGILMAVNADIATWEDVSIAGSGTEEITTAGLTPQEVKAYSNNEYFFVTKNSIKGTPNTMLDVTLKAQPAPASWKCPIITLAARGDYLGTTSGNMQLHSAAKDDSSYTSVYTQQVVTLKTNSCSNSA